MPKYWDFRTILDIHPEWDDRCVAINVRSEKRCGICGKAGKRNLSQAGQLLNTMDRTKSLSECREYMDSLAYLTMCGNPHRNMEAVRADRCRRWDKQILAYVALDERKKAHERKSKEPLETRNAEEAIVAELGHEESVQITPLATAASSQPQEEARQYFFSPASMAVELGTNANDPFITSNEIASRLQPQLEDPIDKSLHTSTVHPPSNDTPSNIFDSKQLEEHEHFMETQLSPQDYGLPSPPNSILVSSESNRQDATRIQSPLETPTKVPVSTNDAELDPPRFESSDHKIQSVSEPLRTPLKRHTRQFEGLLTPEDTPEPPLSETAISILVEGSTAASGSAKPPKSHIDGDFRALGEGQMTGEVTLETLQTEHNEAPEAIERSRSESPKTPTKIYNRYAEDLTTPEATPEPSQIPESSSLIISEEYTSPIESILKTPVETENEEKDDNLTFKVTHEPSQGYGTGEHLVFEESIVAAELPSELALMNEDAVSTTEEDSATPEAILEPSNLDQDSILVIEGDLASSEAESGPPNPDHNSLTIEDESDAESKTEHERSISNDVAYPIIEEDTHIPPIVFEPTNDSLLTRTESFGHALIDPSERRYKTRFSDRQQQALLSTPQIQEPPHSFSSDKDTFSEVEIHIEPFTTASLPKSSLEVATLTSTGEPSHASENERYVVTGEYLGWENNRGMPKTWRGRRLPKEVWRHVREGCVTVAETVRRKSRRSSEIPRE